MDYLQGKKVLVIDDEPTMLQLVEHLFSRAGARVYLAKNGSEGLRLFYTRQPDLVILDLMMPDMDGWEVCEQLRRLSEEVPIIMLTALQRDEELIRGLDCGADDFVTKPFSNNVLLARARTALRRARLLNSPNQAANYSDSYLTIDLGRHRVFVRDRPVKLSATEYRLLVYLVEHAGQVLSLEQILEQVWGEAYLDNSDYVHVYISHLRRKLEPNPAEPVYLLTEHGVGYRFEKQAA